MHHHCDLSTRTHNLHQDMDDLPQHSKHHTTPQDTPLHKLVSPGGLLDPRTRPPSPTNLCDFPYYEYQNDTITKRHASLPLLMKTTTRLPRFTVSSNEQTILDHNHSTDDIITDNVELCESYFAIADIGLSGHVFIAAKSNINTQHLADTGANCCTLRSRNFGIHLGFWDSQATPRMVIFGS
jgi:hypothetical protein